MNKQHTALQWLEETILDELDAIMNERSKAHGRFETEADRAAGRAAARETLRRRWLSTLEVTPENIARAEELQLMGAAAVRSGVRSMFDKGLN